MALDFLAWPSIPRLNRNMIVTEKIDGTNAAIIIEHHGVYSGEDAVHYVERHEDDWSTFRVTDSETFPGQHEVFEIGAQSRKRLIHPGDDNFGFAAWVWDNATALLDALGEGRHYGEWWGSGIQRGYSLAKGEKRFSLFNVSRYSGIDFQSYGLTNVSTVPLLWEGPFDMGVISGLVEELKRDGSFAADLGVGTRFHNPEGVVVFHQAANQVFKVTCENDESPKSLVGA